MLEQGELIQVWHPDGREHQLRVLFASGPLMALVGAAYMGGCANLEVGTSVAYWRVSYEPPNENDSGCLDFIGDDNGRIEIEVESLRGIGLGSLLMLPLVRWAKERPGDVPVVPINLAGPDADTEEKRCMRNRFYEKLGFSFCYDDDGQTFGKSRVMPVSKLITPDFKMSDEWQVESLSSTGKVF